MVIKPLGPGPGAYMLPTTCGFDKHDSRKQRLPQYSFGMRTALLDKRVSPGSGAYQVDKVTRYGPAKGLEFTIAPRTFMTDKSIGPGPGAHDVHLKPCYKGVNAPAYSMGLRSEYAFKKFGPGPNVYKFEVTPVKPSAPAFSIGLATKPIPNKGPTPGPAAYAPGDLNVKLNRAPQYSMASRNKYAFKLYGPGPNYYDLMYYRPGRTGKAYSFGVHHSPYALPMVVKCDNM